MAPDANGRVMVQGPLTATLPTKLGGDMNYIARQMSFDFPRPVFVGDTIICEGTVTRVVREEGRFRVSMAVACVNQHGKEVLSGTTDGVIRLGQSLGELS